MRQRLSYAERASFCQNTVANALLQLMDRKKTNLALSADVTEASQLLELAEEIGPEICILKTHIDIVSDFSARLIERLSQLAAKHQFLIFEDRKFADIGHTVKHQYGSGIFKIADWADMVNAHVLPGPGIISGLAEVGLKKQRGLLLIAEMSSEQNLLDIAYTQKTLAMAEQFPEFVFGFIAQKKLSEQPQWIYLTPGVQWANSGDTLGQQYVTPEQAIQDHLTDVIIVGRGILQAKNRLTEAKKYRASGWNAYCESIAGG